MFENLDLNVKLSGLQNKSNIRALLLTWSRTGKDCRCKFKNLSSLRILVPRDSNYFEEKYTNLSILHGGTEKSLQ